MKKQILLYFFIVTLSSVFGQTIQDLEYDLSFYSSGEKYGEKINKAKKLQELDPFNYSAINYICRYYDDRNIDSVSIFFDNLIAKYPNNSKPYLLRSELLFLEQNYQERDNYNKLKLKYLKSALEISNSDKIIIFKIAEVYYKDFIYPLEKEKEFNFDFDDAMFDSLFVKKKKYVKKSTFKYSADSALVYFYNLWDLDKKQREIIYYPIRQLECYLNETETSIIPSNIESQFDKCYFPSWYFANLEKDWQCKFTVNYLYEIESAKRTAEWLEIQLTDLEENCLYGSHIKANSIIYRFTWLRSFNHPISIRIEKTGDKIMLYWKLGKGAGGYEPQGLKKHGKKKLKLSDWETFQKLILEANFDSLQNEKYVPMTDGATWTLEQKYSNEFKAHNTNSPSKEFRKACIFLLRKTNIRVKKEDIY